MTMTQMTLNMHIETREREDLGFGNSVPRALLSRKQSKTRFNRDRPPCGKEGSMLGTLPRQLSCFDNKDPKNI
jgi:hypothetical protein